MKNYSISLPSMVRIFITGILTSFFMIAFSSSVLAQKPDPLTTIGPTPPRIILTGTGNSEAPQLYTILSSGENPCIQSGALEFENNLGYKMTNITVTLTTANGVIIYNGPVNDLLPSQTTLLNYSILGLSPGQHVVHATIFCNLVGAGIPPNDLFEGNEHYSILVCQSSKTN